MEEEYDNPAGRLHALFERYVLAAQTGVNRRAAWASALGVSEATVHYRIGRIADLLDETRQAYRLADTNRYQSLPNHLDSLANTAFPLHQAYSETANKLLPETQALDMLGAFSDHLHLRRSEGPIPDEDKLASLADDVRDLCTAVTESDLAPEVKRRMLQRLAEVLEALEHIDLGGPGAVERAIAALIGTSLVENALTDEETATKLRIFVGRAWKAFNVVVTLGSGANGWNTLTGG